jgi:hypothetical protein
MGMPGATPRDRPERGIGMEFMIALAGAAIGLVVGNLFGDGAFG